MGSPEKTSNRLASLLICYSAGIGAGELAFSFNNVGTGVVSPLRPLFSLMALLSSLILESLEPAESLLISSANDPSRGWTL